MSDPRPARDGETLSADGYVVVACHDCGLAYGSDGWIECIVPADAWGQISPSGDEGGILCITCIARRLKRLGMDKVPVMLCGTEAIRVAGQEEAFDRGWNAAEKALAELESAVAALRAQLAEARADKEQWAAQATANAKDVLRMNWLEVAGGLYDLCCWNVDWPSVNNGWTVGSDEIDDIAKAQTARGALDEAIAAHPEVLAARAASGEDASNQQTGRARQETDSNG